MNGVTKESTTAGRSLYNPLEMSLGIRWKPTSHRGSLFPRERARSGSDSWRASRGEPDWLPRRAARLPWCVECEGDLAEDIFAYVQKVREEKKHRPSALIQLRWQGRFTNQNRCRLQASGESREGGRVYTLNKTTPSILMRWKESITHCLRCLSRLEAQFSPVYCHKKGTKIRTTICHHQ